MLKILSENKKKKIKRNIGTRAKVEYGIEVSEQLLEEILLDNKRLNMFKQMGWI